MSVPPDLQCEPVYGVRCAHLPSDPVPFELSYSRACLTRGHNRCIRSHTGLNVQA